MEEQHKPLTFHLSDDIIVKIGKDQEEIKVPRLLFKNASKIFQTVGELMAEDRAFSLQVLGKAKILQSSIEDSAAEKFADFIKKALPRLVQTNGIDRLAKLMGYLSEGAITKDHIAKMQYNEVVGLASHLLDTNFETLKNLNASLQAMTSSGQQNKS